MPVIGIDLVQIPEWGIITGYCIESGEEKYYVRDYFDSNTEKYEEMKKFPWILHFLEKYDDPEKRTKIDYFRDAMKQVVKIYQTPIVDKLYHNGKAGFEYWINQLGEESNFTENFQEKWHVNGWLYDLLFDARHAVFVFFRDNLDLFSGEARTKAEFIRDHFEKEIQLIAEDWIHFSMPHWVNKDKGKTWIPPFDPDIDPEPRWLDTTEWTREMRENAKKTLENLQKMEEEGINYIQQLISLL